MTFQPGLIEEGSSSSPRILPEQQFSGTVSFAPTVNPRKDAGDIGDALAIRHRHVFRKYRKIVLPEIPYAHYAHDLFSRGIIPRNLNMVPKK